MAVDEFSQTRLYFNVLISNPPTSTSVISAAIKQDLAESWLGNTADYDATIARLRVPMGAVPYFAFQSNYYYVTIGWRGTNYKVAVSVTDYGTGVTGGAIFWVAQFLDGVNAALASAYGAVQTANPTDYNLFPGHAPLITFNNTTNLMTLTTDVGTFENGNAFSGAIYFNSPLMERFQNLPNKWLAYNSASGIDAQIQIVPRGLANVVTPPAPYVLYSQLTTATTAGATITSLATSAGSLKTYGLPAGTQIVTGLGDGGVTNNTLFLPGTALTATLSASVTAASTSLPINSYIVPVGHGVASGIAYVQPQQILTIDEAPSVLNWCDFTRIKVMTYGGIPTREEAVPLATSVQAPSGQLATEKILTDFLIKPQDKLNGQNLMIYIPEPDWRWIDLLKEEPLRTLDMAFFISNADGSLTLPLILEPGQSVSAKWLFQRKLVHLSKHLNTRERLVMNVEAGGGVAALQRYDGKRRKVMFEH